MTILYFKSISEKTVVSLRGPGKLAPDNSNRGELIGQGYIEIEAKEFRRLRAKVRRADKRQ
jgi:hypothetical protein